MREVSLNLAYHLSGPILSRESSLFSKQLINSRDEGSWEGEVGRLNAHPDSRHVVLILVVCMSKNSCVPLMKDL